MFAVMISCNRMHDGQPASNFTKFGRTPLRIIFLTFFFAAVFIDSAESDSAIDTKEFCDASDGYCSGFIQAAIEIVNSKTDTKVICLPKGTSYGELVDHFLDYYDRNQNQKYDHALTVVTSALKEKYSCPD